MFVGGASALGGALTDIGVADDQVIEYETALKVDKYLLVVHGNAEGRRPLAMLYLSRLRRRGYGLRQ
jgi:hypothetical protein